MFLRFCLYGLCTLHLVSACCNKSFLSSLLCLSCHFHSHAHCIVLSFQIHATPLPLLPWSIVRGVCLVFVWGEIKGSNLVCLLKTG